MSVILSPQMFGLLDRNDRRRSVLTSSKNDFSSLHRIQELFTLLPTNLWVYKRSQERKLCNSRGSYRKQLIFLTLLFSSIRFPWKSLEMRDLKWLIQAKSDMPLVFLPSMSFVFFFHFLYMLLPLFPVSLLKQMPAKSRPRVDREETHSQESKIEEEEEETENNQIKLTEFVQQQK